MEDLNLGSGMGEIYVEMEKQAPRSKVCSTKKSQSEKMNPGVLTLRFVWTAQEAAEERTRTDSFSHHCMEGNTDISFPSCCFTSKSVIEAVPQFYMGV